MKKSSLELSTGWFGQPEGKSTKVHVKKSDGTCLCGYRPHKSFQFQWCAHDIQMDYLECPKCKDKAKKILKLIK